MLSFFKRNSTEKIKKKGKDSSISSSELINDNVDTVEDGEVETTLSLHPIWTLPAEQQYVYRYLNNELAPLQPNQISLAGVEINQDNNNIIVTAFVRNSLPKSIRLGDTDLLLLGPDNDTLARQKFDLSVLGEIPAKSSRPWHFIFTNDSIVSENIPSEEWKLAFNLIKNVKHELALEESWEQNLPESEKHTLREMVEKIEPPKPGEINFLGLKIKQDINKDLHVTILIRNGSNKGIKFEQLPLQVEDSSGDIIAQGGFKMNNFQVAPNTSKPWTFIFPSSLLKKENPDLVSWKAYPVQKQ